MQPIHPFPARMAPDIVRDVLARLPPHSSVIDPMCGSGTVLRHSVEAGHSCLGLDIDPLALLMARAWTTPLPTYRLAHDASDVIRRAQALSHRDVRLPWQDDDTEKFALYWFAGEQRLPLVRLAQAIRTSRFRSRDVLKVALSRLIITKDRGASLARDVSHSRPHRVRTENDFDVYREFLQATRLIAKRLEPAKIRAEAAVEFGDARKAGGHRSGFDLAITSPPYLNAIDYLRGHRLSLIWLGYSIPELQKVRAQATGSERAATVSTLDVSPFIKSVDGNVLPDRYVGWVMRYATDMSHTLTSLRELVRPGGQIVIVVGNSVIRGSSVNNAGIVGRCAKNAALSLIDTRERKIPARHRYLPPPRDGTPFALRMRTESVLTFERAEEPRHKRLERSAKAPSN